MLTIILINLSKKNDCIIYNPVVDLTFSCVGFGNQSETNIWRYDNWELSSDVMEVLNCESGT